MWDVGVPHEGVRILDEKVLIMLAGSSQDVFADIILTLKNLLEHSRIF